MSLLLLAALLQDGSELIDASIDRSIVEAGATAGRRADDFEFVRRVTLDLTGKLPLSGEVGDRVKLVEHLLDSPAFAEYWAEVWVRTLLGYDFFTLVRQDLDYRKLRDFLRDAFAKNRPYDEWVKDLIAAEGDSIQTNFLMRYFSQAGKQPTQAAGQVTRVFLGIQMQCAQCHDHPFDAWRREQFWEMAAFFQGTRQRISNTFDGVKTKLIDADSGEITMDGTDRKMTPRFLEGQEPAAGEKRRAALAKFVTGSRQFARSIVNRVWAQFFGRGFVEPIDKFTAATKAPELLDKLADELIRRRFDLKWLMRAIVNSKTYQRTSKVGKGEVRKDKLFTHAAVRPMNPVQLLNALLFAVGAEEFFKNSDELQKQQYVLYLFVQALLGITNQESEAQRYQGTVQQALVFMNSKDFNNALETNPLLLQKIMTQAKTPEERVDAIFLRLLSRHAAKTEVERFVKYARERKESHAAYADIYWVVMNTNEFFFNH